MDNDNKRSNSFEDVARHLECDESEDALDKAMDGLKVKVEPEKDSAEEK